MPSLWAHAGNRAKSYIHRSVSQSVSLLVAPKFWQHEYSSHVVSRTAKLKLALSRLLLCAESGTRRIIKVYIRPKRYGEVWKSSNIFTDETKLAEIYGKSRTTGQRSDFTETVAAVSVKSWITVGWATVMGYVVIKATTQYSCKNHMIQTPVWCLSAAPTTPRLQSGSLSAGEKWEGHIVRASWARGPELAVCGPG